MRLYLFLAAAVVFTVHALTPGFVSAQSPVRLDDREAMQELRAKPPMVRPTWAIQVEHKVVLRHDTDPPYESRHRTWFSGEFEVPDEAGSNDSELRIVTVGEGNHTWQDGPAGPCEASEGGPLHIEVDIRGVATRGRLLGFILSFGGSLEHRSSYKVSCASPDGETYSSPKRKVSPLLPPAVMLPRQPGTYVGPPQLITPPYDAVSSETTYILTAECVASPAPPLRYAVNVTNEVREVSYHHDLNRDQIRALGEGQGNNVGLTTFDLTMSSKIEATSLSGDEGNDCMWVSHIDVGFNYQAIDVYLASNYPKGSCEYQATFDHEIRHVRADRAIVEKFTREAEAAVAATSLPSYSKPLWNTPLAKAMREAEVTLGSVLKPLFQRMTEARDEAADALDTAARYDEVQSRCTAW